MSPKGPIGSLRVLGPREVAYLDIAGSGAETIAHLRENGRIVVMLCAFEGPPRIVRLHGEGAVLLPGDPATTRCSTRAAFEDPSIPEARRAIVRVARVADRRLVRLRRAAHVARRPAPALDAVGAEEAATGGPDAIEDYIAERNAVSIDGLPAVERS